jgi:micrococcal nuclease
VTRAVLVALVLALAAGCAESPSSSPPPAPSERTVADVTDGDTLRLDDGTRVRLVQIDAPEPGEGECYAREATAALRRLVPDGAAVEIATDPALDRVDRFGRVLAYVTRDGANVNVELVRAGAAAPYFFRGDRGRHADALLRAASEAQAARRGLWGACPFARLDPERALAAGG